MTEVAPGSPTAACPKCGMVLSEGEQFCGNCGNPMSGVPKSISLGKIASKYQRQVHTKKIKSGRGAILASAILVLIEGLVTFLILQSAISDMDRTYQEGWYEQAGKVVSKDEILRKAQVITIIVMAVYALLACTYLCLWVWAKRNPLPATITALVIYLSLWLVYVMIDPNFLYRGILVKLIVVACLVGGIKSALMYRKLQPRPSP